MSIVYPLYAPLVPAMTDPDAGPAILIPVAPIAVIDPVT